MSGALVSYELMLDDASLLPKDVVKNLAIQYLGWNYTIFQHMIREKERTSSLYEKVKSNCVCYQEYSCYLGLADRIGINAIAKHNYTCAKLSVQAVGILIWFLHECLIDEFTVRKSRIRLLSMLL